MTDIRSVRPQVDPEIAAVAEAMRGSIPPFTADTLPGIRAVFEQAPPIDLTADGAVRVDERVVPGPPDAPDITLLTLTPATGTGPWPLIYSIHGGGVVIGDRRFAADLFLSYVAEGLAVVVSPEYRLAPEHQDPAPVEDCYAGLTWAADHATELGIDAERILVGGASAGGGLTAGVALLARDRAFPNIGHQMLICPMLDDRLITASSRMLETELVWDRPDNEFGWTALLGDRRGGEHVSVYAAPARADDLAGLPRSYVDVGTAESFRDEAIDYAKRLSEAGVTVDLHVWGGAFHGSDFATPTAGISRAAQWVRDDFVRRALR